MLMTRLLVLEMYIIMRGLDARPLIVEVYGIVPIVHVLRIQSVR